MSGRKAEIKPARLRKLLKRMVDIYSPSGKEEELLDFLHGYLKRRGLPVERQYLPEDNRFNLVVFPENDDVDVQLALVGHLDTVAAHDLENYGFWEDGDTVYGLGVADMKGGCAAMVEAFLALWENGETDLPVALALVVGEEEEGDGAYNLVKEYDFPWAIVGEPTGLTPCLSNYGYLEINMIARGKRVHASMAKMAQNPIQSMLALLSGVIRHLEEGRPDFIFNVRDMYSSRAGFAVPDYCEAWLDLHFPPTSPIAEIMAELEEIVGKEMEKRQNPDAAMRFSTVDAGYRLPEKGPVVEALRDVYRKRSMEWAPGEFRSHSDASQLWDEGVRPVILGPGRLEMAHTPDEAASFAEICAAAEIYADILVSVSK